MFAVRRERNSGKQAKDIREQDDITAVECVSHGKEIPESLMDRTYAVLEGGIGYRNGRESVDGGSRRRTRSIEGRAVAFANRINALSLGMTRLKAFRERQGDVFKVLAGVK